jgi:hypothetical protein
MCSSENYTTQDNLLKKSLSIFYDNNENLQKMLDIVSGTSLISLRIVDWFTTNYSKKYYTTYNTIVNGIKTDESIHNQKRFKVYNEYKLRLKSYSKRRFDPFCRWERIKIPYDNNNCIETTLGQLNFFKWAIENNVIEFITEHYNDIERDMNVRNNVSASNRKKANPDTKTRKKRKELSEPANKSIQKECVNIVITFT